jgi:cbb3-type cytochrome oxidase maturation protein
MSALYILILVSLLVALGFLAAYIWAVRDGQYDDTTTPSMRILMDDPARPGSAPERIGPAVADVAPGGRQGARPEKSVP